MVEKKSEKNYRLIQCLGSGMTADVYLAERYDSNLKFKEKIALKWLRSDISQEFFDQEIKRLKKLKGKCFVECLGWDFIEGRPAIILDYIEGFSLTYLLKNEKLTLAEVQALESMLNEIGIELHRNELIHSDISPSNLLVDRSGQLKILDFGISQQEPAATDIYAAPEVLKGAKPTFSADWYSIARVIEDLYLCNGHELPADSRLSPNPHERQLATKKSITPEAKRSLSHRVNTWWKHRCEQTTEVIAPPLPKPMKRKRKFVRDLSIATASGVLIWLLAWPAILHYQRTTPSDTQAKSGSSDKPLDFSVRADCNLKLSGPFKQRSAPFDMKFARRPASLNWRSSTGSGTLDIPNRGTQILVTAELPKCKPSLKVLK